MLATAFPGAVMKLYTDKLRLQDIGVRYYTYQYTMAREMRFCAEAGIAFRAVPLLLDGGEPVSSSRIRELLEAGLREEAERLAGHPLPDPGQEVPETI